MVIGICFQKEAAASYTNDIPDKKPPEKQERSSRGSRNQRQPCTVNNRIQNQRDDTGKDRTGDCDIIVESRKNTFLVRAVFYDLLFLPATLLKSPQDPFRNMLSLNVIDIENRIFFWKS